MSKRLIPLLKIPVHLLCLAPFADLLWRAFHGDLGSDPVKTITHFTGSWAMYMLLLTLAVTPVRRLHPALAGLIRFRRLLGLYAFFYATLHLGTYVFLFSGYDVETAFAGLKAGHPGEIVEQLRLVWPTIWDDVRKRRFVQVGFAAWLILLALAVTSPRFMLRAMGGRRWQRLHWLAYVAASLAIVHFWWQMKPGVLTPWKDTVALAVLLLARVVYSLMRRRTKTKVPQAV